MNRPLRKHRTLTRSQGEKVRRPQGANVHTALQALESRLKQAENAFNTNTQVFSDSIKMLEAQNAVLRWALQDSISSKLRKLPDGDIDWNSYLKEYIEELARREAKSAEAAPATLLVEPGEDSPIIFGGNGA
jgi:hypothetical protein